MVRQAAVAGTHACRGVPPLGVPLPVAARGWCTAHAGKAVQRNQIEGLAWTVSARILEAIGP